jgi:hypothetical protein
LPRNARYYFIVRIPACACLSTGKRESNSPVVPAQAGIQQKKIQRSRPNGYLAPLAGYDLTQIIVH